jgi:hypothetical protein
MEHFLFEQEFAHIKNRHTDNDEPYAVQEVEGLTLTYHHAGYQRPNGSHDEHSR